MKGALRGRQCLKTQPYLQPPIPETIALKQRIQDFSYNFSEAARCKSLWIRKVTEHRIAHVHTYSTRAADTASELKRCYRIEWTSKNQNPPQSLKARPSGTHNQVIQFPDPSLSALYQSQPLILAQRSSPRSHWYMR